MTPTEAVLVLRQPQGAPSPAHSRAPAKWAPTATLATSVLRIQLVGANAAPLVTPLDELPGQSHYLRGRDPQQWLTQIPHYGKVRYAAVYPDIDLLYYGNQRQLEYDFVVSPRADPTAIRLAFQGADSLSVNAAGNLILQTAHGKVIQGAPNAYQERDGTRQDVPARYVLIGESQVGIQVAAYDRDRPLIIDPVLVYSTFLGGSGGDAGRGLPVDLSGQAYVMGWTDSPDFPTENLLQPALRGGSNAGTDAFVAKLDRTGSQLVYATYLGGS